MSMEGTHLICEKCSNMFRRERAEILTPEAAYGYFRAMASAKVERLVALYLTTAGRPIRRATIAIGTLNTTSAHPREILRPGIACAADSYVIAHNHPSGSLRPSQDDLDFTRKLISASRLVGIELKDHLIVSRNGYTSLRESGLI
ncbi:MAG TPA: JAB domain-containing protein [Candidatus Polarisedimenticolia bacterium]|nr:JAB domain-containing protein [Candidatus Polarisedimenticolia bacterium]